MYSYLLSGSFAYDTILFHEGELQSRILADSLSNLNVAFGIQKVQNEFGGTGGNIAYNASLLGQKPLLIGTLGEKDSVSYLNHLKANNLDYNGLTIIENELSPHAWLLTDKNNNQITSFSQGSMKYIPSIPIETPNIWHLSPENPNTMATLALEAIRLNKKYFFDPGQVLPYFLEGITNDILSLENIIKNASGLFVNEYESSLLSNYLHADLKDFMSEKNDFFIKTLGNKGVALITKNETTHFGVAKTKTITDPTGCGDAFRAGFLYGYTKELSLENCAMLGATMGSFSIESLGGQNHKPTIDEIKHRLLDSYNIEINDTRIKQKKY